jgi:hypothetical protein
MAVLRASVSSRLILQDAKDRNVLRARKPLKQAHDLLACFRVEARHRFIGQQHARPLRERARDGDALRFTSRECASALFSEVHQVELAYTYADRVIGIRGGRVAFDLPRDQVSREAVRRLYVGEAA